jgi:hypothetical protein
MTFNVTSANFSNPKNLFFSLISSKMQDVVGWEKIVDSSHKFLLLMNQLRYGGIVRDLMVSHNYRELEAY